MARITIWSGVTIGWPQDRWRAHECACQVIAAIGAGLGLPRDIAVELLRPAELPRRSLSGWMPSQLRADKRMVPLQRQPLGRQYHSGCRRCSEPSRRLHTPGGTLTQRMPLPFALLSSDILTLGRTPRDLRSWRDRRIARCMPWRVGVRARVFHVDQHPGTLLGRLRPPPRVFALAEQTGRNAAPRGRQGAARSVAHAAAAAAGRGRSSSCIVHGKVFTIVYGCSGG